MAAILAYIEIAALRDLAFSEDFLRLRTVCAAACLSHHCIIDFLYFVIFFSFESSLCLPKKNDFVVSGRAECRDLLRNVVGHQGMKKKNKTILLRESTFNLWNQRKIDLGFQGNTNSEVAEFLLHSLVQWQFEEESVRNYG